MRNLNEKSKSRFSVIALMIVTGIAVLSVIAFMNNNSSSELNNLPQAGVGGGPGQPVNELFPVISENPSNYLGKAVTLSGEIESVLGEKIFVLTDPEDAGSDSKILVLVNGLIPQKPNRSPDFPLNKGDEVVITGFIRQMVIDQIEDEADVDIPEQAEVDFTDNAVIIADSLTFKSTDKSLHPSVAPIDEKFEPGGNVIKED